MTPTAATPSVEQARVEYLYLAAASVYHPRNCAWCRNRSQAEADNHWALKADAASIVLDLAVAAHFSRGGATAATPTTAAPHALKEGVS